MSMKSITGFLSKNSPTILTIMGAVGLVTTVAMAIKATPKAEDILYDAELEKGDGEERIPLTKTEVIKETWKVYLPTALMGTASIACIFGAQYCGKRQREVLASSYILAQTTLQEYQRRVVERIGENKEKEIQSEVRTAIAHYQAPVANFTVESKEAYDTGHGKSLFYDIPSDTYFRSELNFLKKTMNDLNSKMIGGSEPYLDYNDIRSAWGLPWYKLGSEMIVTPERQLELHFDPELMENGDVRINVDYELYPKSEMLRR